jgi:hypothetical protein
MPERPLGLSGQVTVIDLADGEDAPGGRYLLAFESPAHRQAVLDLLARFARCLPDDAHGIGTSPTVRASALGEFNG